MKMKKLTRIILGVLFCIMGVFLIYYAYKNWQNNYPSLDNLLHPLYNGAVIASSFVVLIGSFAAVMLLAGDDFYQHSSVRLMAQLTMVCCIVSGVFLALVSLYILFISLGLDRQFNSMAAATGLITAMLIAAFFVIKSRVSW
jgi:hypothetical protein